MAWQHFIISRMTAKIAQPSKGSFNHPTAFEQRKSGPFFGDDLQVDLRGRLKTMFILSESFE